MAVTLLALFSPLHMLFVEGHKEWNATGYSHRISHPGRTVRRWWWWSCEAGGQFPPLRCHILSGWWTRSSTQTPDPLLDRSQNHSILKGCQLHFYKSPKNSARLRLSLLKYLRGPFWIHLDWGLVADWWGHYAWLPCLNYNTMSSGTDFLEFGVNILGDEKKHLTSNK